MNSSPDQQEAIEEEGINFALDKVKPELAARNYADYAYRLGIRKGDELKPQRDGYTGKLLEPVPNPIVDDLNDKFVAALNLLSIENRLNNRAFNSDQVENILKYVALADVIKYLPESGESRMPGDLLSLKDIDAACLGRAMISLLVAENTELPKETYTKEELLEAGYPELFHPLIKDTQEGLIKENKLTKRDIIVDMATISSSPYQINQTAS